MELKMFNGIFNRVVPQAFLTGGVTHAQRFIFTQRPSPVLRTSSPAPASEEYRVASEEIFGPVLSVMTFRTPEEAFERANNTPCGLSAGVWTDKGSKIFKLVNKLRAGVVWANTYNKFDPTSPFGGYKESGFGREGGLQGLAAYCRFD